MVARSIIHHKSSKLKSLNVFYKLLPEFSEVPISSKSVVDKAFEKSIVNSVSDVKEWRPIREEALKSQSLLTPRELARFKFSLCHQSPDLHKAFLGRPALHDYLGSKAKQMLPHMNALELISVISAFSNTSPPDFYEESLNFLCNEIKETEDLDTLAMSVYAVCNHYNHTSISLPMVKGLKHSELSGKFIHIVSPKLIDKITEFSDDQFATICAGVGRASVTGFHIEVAYPLMRAVESEVLSRRAKRMSLDNLIDVGSGFFNNNLGSNSLAETINGRVLELKDKIGYLAGVDYALSISERQVCSPEIIKIVNEKIKSNYNPNDYMRISNFIFNTQCKDPELIKLHLLNLAQLKTYQPTEYFELKKLKYYAQKHFKDLVPDEFIEKLESSGYLFNAENFYAKDVESRSIFYYKFNQWFKFLHFNCKGPYVYENHDIMHWAWMPQKVALMLAMPKFHLIGEWEEDERIVKEPKRKFKIANSFEIRCKWLELLGFMVIRANYQEISENSVSKVERDKEMIQTLKKLKVSPYGVESDPTEKAK